jgi:hypothetical protein
MKHKGLNQIVCAALINERFREVLLHHPARAIAAGYGGQSFSLTPEERDMVIGIRAERLEDWAAEIHNWISRSSHDGKLSATARSDSRGHMYAPRSHSLPAADCARVAAAV